MIYVALGFLAVLCAALGGILYQKGRDYSDLNNAVQALSRTVESQDGRIRQQLQDLMLLEVRVANSEDAAKLGDRLVALERKQTDTSKPQVVRGINAGRRMAAELGGVTGVERVG